MSKKKRTERPCERLRAYRSNKGLTGRAAAKLCGMSSATYNRIENGHDVRASSLLKLDKLLGVSLYWMLTGIHAESLISNEKLT